MGAGHRVGLGARAGRLRRRRPAPRRSSGSTGRSSCSCSVVPCLRRPYGCAHGRCSKIDGEATIRRSASARVLAVALSAEHRLLERVERVAARADQPRRRHLPQRRASGSRRTARSTSTRSPARSPDSSSAALIADVDRHEAARAHHLEFDLSHMLLGDPRRGAEPRRQPPDVPHGPDPQRVRAARFYLFATRLLPHPVAALGATATLAFLMPQVSFSRDSTTEIPIQVLLFTALWLLCDRRTLRTPGPAFVAGLLLGLVQAMHIDGLAFLVGLPVGVRASPGCTPSARPARARRAASSGRPWGSWSERCSAPSTSCRWDRYYLSVVHKNVAKLAAAWCSRSWPRSSIVLLVRRRAGFLEAFKRMRPRAAYVAGVLVLIGGFGAWFVRPHGPARARRAIEPMVAFVQRINHLPIDGTKRYAELSVRWISWYIGPDHAHARRSSAPPGSRSRSCAARCGCRPRSRRSCSRRPRCSTSGARAITPDQIWAARRFLPAVFPALILLAFAVICALARGSKPASQPPPVGRDRAGRRHGRVPDV